MSLRLVNYPHPTLRHKSRPLKRVDVELKRWVEEMFELMHQHQGIGLAANQVDLPYRVFVLNLSGDPEATDQRQVFLNPVVQVRKGSAEDQEGCLSLPGLYAQVRRPEKITISAYNLRGEAINQEIDGLFARAFQHELDHLDGVLFIDRLTVSGELKVKEKLLEFEEEFQRERQAGHIPSDAEIASRLASLEQART